MLCDTCKLLVEFYTAVFFKLAKKPLCWAVVTPPSVRELLSAVAGFAKCGQYTQPAGAARTVHSELMILEPERSQPCTTGHEDGLCTGEENADHHQERLSTVSSLTSTLSLLGILADNRRGLLSDLTLGYR
ncbi:hypothetical protein MHYP_G00287740 [Metynnis hypsauchen]